MNVIKILSSKKVYLGKLFLIVPVLEVRQPELRKTAQTQTNKSIIVDNIYPSTYLMATAVK